MNTSQDSKQAAKDLYLIGLDGSFLRIKKLDDLGEFAEPNELDNFYGAYPKDLEINKPYVVWDFYDDVLELSDGAKVQCPKEYMDKVSAPFCFIQQTPQKWAVFEIEYDNITEDEIIEDSIIEDSIIELF